MTAIKAKVYTQDGKQKEDITLPDFVFDVPWNGDLVHQVITSMNANKRQNIAKSKDRSEVSGGGKKPWRQKGTGRARHGSRRSPIWKGGGVTHGPTAEKSFQKKINKKMKIKALYTVLSEKFRNGEILFIDSINLSDTKTKQAHSILVSLGTITGFERLGNSKKKVAHLSEFESSDATRRSFKNIPYVSLGESRNMNPLDVLQYRYLLIANPKESIEVISKRLSQSKKSSGSSGTQKRTKKSVRSRKVTKKTAAKKKTAKKAPVKKAVSKKVTKKTTPASTVKRGEKKK